MMVDVGSGTVSEPGQAGAGLSTDPGPALEEWAT